MTDKRPKDDDEAAATASYIADLSADLAQMARRQGLNTLGYLLDMARLEAENLRRMQGPGA